MITFWPSVNDPQGRRLRVTWAALFERFAKPLVVADKLRAPGWSPALFVGDKRAWANVESVGAVGLDVEGTGADFDKSSILWSKHAACLHTTWSHAPTEHRLRVIIIPTRIMTPAEAVRVRRFCARKMDEAGQPCDPRAADLSRLWFTPSVPPGGEAHYRCLTRWGGPLDVDAVLGWEPELPSAPPPPVYEPVRAEATTVERVRKYLDQCEPAISGAGGHTTTLLIAEKLTVGFLLSPDTAYALLAESWNLRCQPPWDERSLRRKCRESTKGSKLEPGSLLNRPPPDRRRP